VLLIDPLLQDLLGLIFLAVAAAPLLVLLSEGLRLAGALPLLVDAWSSSNSFRSSGWVHFCPYSFLAIPSGSALSSLPSYALVFFPITA